MAAVSEALRIDGLFRRLKLILASFRRDLRDVELGQILVCAIMGAALGLVVGLLREGVIWLHGAAFAIPAGHFLSEGIGIAPGRLVLVPFLGGLVLGATALFMRARRVSEIVDPIEANALYGGRMSLRESLWLAFVTLLSNGAGASLGMEAGYSQLGAGVYSWLGRWLRLRRASQRVFVTAGAGAAIAAAFNAPLAGAFYGYELIQGSYTTAALAPVVVASVCAGLTQRAVTHTQALFQVSGIFPVTSAGYFLLALLGVVAAMVAVLAMQTVTWTERVLRRTGVPEWLRPAAGGLVLSAIAWFAPQVLGSGHGAVQLLFNTPWPLAPLALLLAAKLLASAISVGSGFRGGMFSSALLLGTLLGAVFIQSAAFFVPALGSQHAIFMLAGMGAVAGAIIGAPLTMVFLVLEATGDFEATVAVVIAVTVASSLVRILFGYSFATWRFHLRGLSIRGGHDVGWIGEMTVGRFMRADAKTVPENLGLKALRAAFPPGGIKQFYVVDSGHRYIGAIDVDDLHDPAIDDALDGAVASDLATGADQFLLPAENIRGALARFDALANETLPVLLSDSQRSVVGYLTEAYALKRYAQELERMRSAELGQRDLFSMGPMPGDKMSHKP